RPAPSVSLGPSSTYRSVSLTTPTPFPRPPASIPRSWTCARGLISDHVHKSKIAASGPSRHAQLGQVERVPDERGARPGGPPQDAAPPLHVGGLARDQVRAAGLQVMKAEPDTVGQVGGQGYEAVQQGGV